MEKCASDLYLLYLNGWTGMKSDDAVLTAGFTQRTGGVSKPPRHSFNLALHVGDDEEAVLENRRRLMTEIGFELDAWTCAEQVHSNHVVIAGKSDRGKGSLSREEAIADADGLLTQEKNICLVSFYADCVPLYFFEPKKQIIGLAHAGWKGTAARIAEVMVRKMIDEMQADPSRIQAAIGPSIGACCYEVDHRIADLFQRMLPEHAVARPNGEGKYMLDLKESNRQIMIKAGIFPENIMVTKYCTGCDANRFFSHRRDRGLTGRMASWIGWQTR
mgnify:CR=1 FL=1